MSEPVKLSDVLPGVMAEIAPREPNQLDTVLFSNLEKRCLFQILGNPRTEDEICLVLKEPVNGAVSDALFDLVNKGTIVWLGPNDHRMRYKLTEKGKREVCTMGAPDVT